MENKKIKCLIIEDEEPAVKILEKYILASEHLQLVAIAPNAPMAFEILHRQQIELIFLDIQLPRMDGISFLSSLKNPPKVIFTTAYRDYALDGFELNVVDYLLKPIALQRFDRAILKLLKIELNETLKTESLSERFLYFTINRQQVKVILSKILLVESLRDHSKIILSDKTLTVKQSISSIEQLLPEEQFMRVHRSFIINCSHVIQYNRSSIRLISGMDISIGRFYKEAVTKKLSC